MVIKIQLKIKPVSKPVRDKPIRHQPIHALWPNLLFLLRHRLASASVLLLHLGQVNGVFLQIVHFSVWRRPVEDLGAEQGRVGAINLGLELAVLFFRGAQKT